MLKYLCIVAALMQPICFTQAETRKFSKRSQLRYSLKIQVCEKSCFNKFK